MSIVCLHLTEIDISSTFYSKHKKETPLKSCEAYKQSTNLTEQEFELELSLLSFLSVFESSYQTDVNFSQRL